MTTNVDWQVYKISNKLSLIQIELVFFLFIGMTRGDLTRLLFPPISPPPRPILIPVPFLIFFVQVCFLSVLCDDLIVTHRSFL